MQLTRANFELGSPIQLSTPISVTQPAHPSNRSPQELARDYNYSYYKLVFAMTIKVIEIENY